MTVTSSSLSAAAVTAAPTFTSSFYIPASVSVCFSSSSSLTSSFTPSSISLSAASSQPPPSLLPSYLADDGAEGGYPTELFDAQQLEQHPDLVCHFCTEVCRAVVCCPTECAALFCSSCLDRWFAQGRRECPICCRQHKRGAFQRSQYAEKQIRGMTVACPNQCGTAGLMIGVDERSIREHLSRECTERSFECSRGCGEMLRVGGTAAHDEECAHNVVPCPNRCIEYEGALSCGHPSLLLLPITTRHTSLMPHHVATECPNTELPCALCCILVKRCEWDVHQRSTAHQLEKAKEAMLHASQSIAALLNRVQDDVKEEVAAVKSKLDAVFHASVVTAAMARANQLGSSAASWKAESARSCNCQTSADALTRCAPTPHSHSHEAAISRLDCWKSFSLSQSLTQPTDLTSSLVCGSSVECSDSRGVWRTGEVTEVYGEYVQVHFARSSAKLDEWIARDSGRIRPLLTMSVAVGTGSARRQSGNASRKRQRRSSGRVRR